MNLIPKIIKFKVDFDYGKNNGLVYIATLIQLATFIEVIQLSRWWYFILIPSGIIVTYLWGLILRKSNIRKMETDYINDENRAITEIRNSIKK
jgi:hypothetical protein